MESDHVTLWRDLWNENSKFGISLDPLQIFVVFFVDGFVDGSRQCFKYSVGCKEKKTFGVWYFLVVTQCTSAGC
jgi:hypothetical protein